MRRLLKMAFATALLLFFAAALGRLRMVSTAYAESAVCSSVGAGPYCGHKCWMMSPYSGCTWVPTYVVVDRPQSGPSPV